ncbi:MAG TPA: MBG domain-containing protein, partial [Devosia sp.]|nr:MBG domain-containing protein [Devosia sp.]
DSPLDNHDFGGLDTQNTAIWNAAAFAPVGATGNRYVFAYRPTLTFTSNDATKTYGDTGTPLTYGVTGLMAGVSGAYLGNAPATAYAGAPKLSSLGGLATASVAGGPYAITIANDTLTSSSGYAFNFASTGLLTVDKAALTITANAANKLYGETLAFNGTEFTVGAGQLRNGDSVTSVSLTSSGSAATASVGAYGIGASAAIGILDLGNYAISYTGGLLQVTPRAISFGANDLSRLYGEANPAMAFGPVIGGDGLASFDAGLGAAGFGLATAATTTANAGLYAITLTGTNDNYAVSFAPGALTIDRRAIAITADDQARQPGASDPTLTWQLTGGSLASFDSLGNVVQGAPARAQGEVPGTYSILQGTLMANANYALAYLPGTLTITAVPDNGVQPPLVPGLSGAQHDFFFGWADDGQCADGVLGPDCAAAAYSGNRTLTGMAP